MGHWFFVMTVGIIFLAGCATASKKPNVELQQCQSHVEFIEEQLKEKEAALAQREREYHQQTVVGNKRASSVSRQNDVGGSVLASVNQVQSALKKAGYYQGAIDGKMGVKTQDAIVRFQKDKGLKADGKVGQMTWVKLKGYLNK